MLVGGDKMKSLPAYTKVTPQLDDDQLVPEELVGRLYSATEGAVMDLVDRFTLLERANLAMYCYRKAHLHGIGLAIAATCDQSTLETTWGISLGRALYAQSRERPVTPPTPATQRSKITLARSAGSDLAAAGSSASNADLDDDAADDGQFVVDLN
jgi:hypothetical protein